MRSRLILSVQQQGLRTGRQDSGRTWGSISRRTAAAGGVSSTLCPLPAAAPWKKEDSATGSSEMPFACFSPDCSQERGLK